MMMRFGSAGTIDIGKREAQMLLDCAQTKVFCVEIDKGAQKNGRSVLSQLSAAPQT